MAETRQQKVKKDVTSRDVVELTKDTLVRWNGFVYKIDDWDDDVDPSDEFLFVTFTDTGK